MATRIHHAANDVGFTTFEAVLAPNEVVILPVRRATSKNGDSTLAVAAPAGFSVTGTIEHRDVIQNALRNQAYLASVAGDYPATPAPDLVISPYFYPPVLYPTAEVIEFKQTMTALKITASPAGGRIIVYGDY